jgi:hypothetical protein
MLKREREEGKIRKREEKRKEFRISRRLIIVYAAEY